MAKNEKDNEATEKADIENNGTRLKELDLGKPIFEANGKEYFIEPHVSAERYKEMQLLEVHLGFGLDYKTMNENLREIYEDLNEQQFADAAVGIYNLMEGVGDVESREMPVMKYCTMFINTDKEDRRVVDEKVMNAKLEDWKKEGIAYHSFFLTAINMVNGLKENLEKHIQDTSKK